MFRDDAPTISTGLVPFWAPEKAKPCSSSVWQAKASARTLYASLLHCSPCEQDVRIYSKLPDVLASEVRADCPCCGRTMRTRGYTRQSHASDCSETRYPERLAAWAA
jgi:ssDNA-binding Zn-finger/Zn-ribbon topoisomerase 1